MADSYKRGPVITCSCGATLQVWGTLLKTQAEQEQRFLDAHAVCREALAAEGEQKP